MLTVLIPEEGETWRAFAQRMRRVDGEILVILPAGEGILPVTDEKELHAFFDACSEMSERVQIATVRRMFVSLARSKGIRVIEHVRDVRDMLEGHPGASEALRILSPHVWKQQLRSRLQSMGLLSLPKLRIWVLIFVSGLLMLFVLFRLLPSAEVNVWPHGDTISQTANIFLVQSGATVDIPPRVRTLELIPRTIHVHRSITFDQISKDFIGTNAKVPMIIINKSDEKYSLRKGSRLANQAGMIFRLTEQVFVDVGEEITVLAIADDFDLYGEIIGERGNVPAGLKWEFPGLAKEERALVYGENRVKATGGTTAYSDVLKKEDLAVARKQLEQELLAMANQMLDEERTLFNATHGDQMLERLYYPEFTLATFSGFVLQTQFLGEEVASIPVEGEIEYTAFVYDKKHALEMLYGELKTHVEDGKRLVDDSINLDRLIHHVIDYADDLSWIKLTVDLSGKEQFILDPLTPSGAHFAMHIRELVAGKSKEEALGIVKNLPEVDSVRISLWPPWARSLPAISSHIIVTPMGD